MVVWVVSLRYNRWHDLLPESAARPSHVVGVASVICCGRRLDRWPPQVRVGLRFLHGRIMVSQCDQLEMVWGCITPSWIGCRCPV